MPFHENPPWHDRCFALGAEREFGFKQPTISVAAIMGSGNGGPHVHFRKIKETRE